MKLKGIELNENTNNYYIDIEDENLMEMEYAILSLEIKVTYDKRCEYPKFKDTNGHVIDYGYPVNEWCKFKYKFKVETINEIPLIRINVENDPHVPFEIRNVKIEKSEKDKPLLGGVKLYQMEGISLMMCYCIKTPTDKLIVIDGGYPHDLPNLMTMISSHNYKVDHWFLTHFHEDHCTALIECLNKEDVEIENLYFNLPTEADIKTMSEDKDHYVVKALSEALDANRSKVKNIIKVSKGGIYPIDEYATFRCLNDPWITKNDNFGNNSGVMYTMHTKGETVLFLGDMGDRGDYYLEDLWVRKEVEESTIIQMAHHCQHGVTDYFYDTIKNMRICLYPAATWIYDNKGDKGFDEFILGSFHTRDYVRNREVMRIYVLKDGRALIE